MSDNRKRFAAIYNAIRKLYPTEPCGNTARHLTTLAMLISGIVASKRVNLPAIAGKIPSMTKVESQVKRFSRWIENENINFEFYYLPYAQQLVTSLAQQTLVLVMDGSPVGRGCRTLMLSVLYKKRALPLAWLVSQGSKGHFSEENHINLIEQVKEIIPEDAEAYPKSCTYSTCVYCAPKDDDHRYFDFLVMLLSNRQYTFDIVHG